MCTDHADMLNRNLDFFLEMFTIDTAQNLSDQILYFFVTGMAFQR